MWPGMCVQLKRQYAKNSKKVKICVDFWTINCIVIPVLEKKLLKACASGSVVEYRLAKARVAGSNIPSRAFFI